MNLILSILLATSIAKAEFPPKSTPELVSRGQVVFSQNCVVCHGDHGQGDGPAAGSMDPKPRNLVKDKFKAGDSPKQIFNTITNGLYGTSMPPFEYLSEQDRAALAYYVESLRKK